MELIARQIFWWVNMIRKLYIFFSQSKFKHYQGKAQSLIIWQIRTTWTTTQVRLKRWIILNMGMESPWRRLRPPRRRVLRRPRGAPGRSPPIGGPASPTSGKITFTHGQTGLAPELLKASYLPGQWAGAMGCDELHQRVAGCWGLLFCNAKHGNNCITIFWITSSDKAPCYTWKLAALILVYGEKLIQITPLTVTLFKWHFWQVPNDRFVTKLPLVTVTIWLQWNFLHVPRVSP